MALHAPTTLPATKTSPSPCLLSLTGNNASAAAPCTCCSKILHACAKQAYICRDCGKPFEKLPDNYFCPVCGAPKRRFREYMPAVAKKMVRTRKTQIKRDEAIGRALPIAVVVGVVACLKILKVVIWR